MAGAADQMATTDENLTVFFIDIDNYPSFTIAKIETVNPR